MDKFLQSCIVGLMFGGVFGLSSEIGGSMTEPFYWMCFVVLGLIAMILINLYRKDWIYPMKPKTDWQKQDRRRFYLRMETIKKIADKNMQTAQYGGHFPVRKTVVVEWEDLLKMWDLADLAKNETPI